MMKIAVPTVDNHVDDHFGHCDHYTIFTIEDCLIVERTTLPSPQGCGCKSGVATTLAEMGVKVMLAGNMGDGAKRKLAENGITVIRGCSGDIDALVEHYLAGEIDDSGESCSAHGADHKCAHSSHSHDGGFGGSQFTYIPKK